MLKQYANKEVLAVRSAEYAGTVIGAYVNKTNYRPVGLAVKHEHMYILPEKRILGNNERIAIDSMSSMNEPTDEHILLELNKTSCYTDEGEYCGLFSDLTLKGKPMLIWFDKPFPIRRIAAANASTVTINLSLRSPNSKISTSKTKAKKSLDDYAFLSGRIVIRDIYGENGEMLIRRGSVVNQAILALAYSEGKLIQLSLSVLLD